MPKKPITIEKLAGMIGSGFENVCGRIDNMKNEVNTRLDKMDIRLDNLEQGQEEIKLRQDNAAYRFEVEDLKKRVKKLEVKVGVRRT